jgi:hypothetical protein
MFKRLVQVGVFAGVLLGSPLAFASGDVTGVIEKIDIPTRQLMLDGERSFPVARGINLAKFAIGEKVVVRTEDEAGKKDLITKIRLGDYFPPPTPKRVRNRTIP